MLFFPAISLFCSSSDFYCIDLIDRKANIEL
jgi:hypothetical protein